MLKVSHVGVVVVRKLPAQSVARLARFAVADAVGDDDEVLARIEKAARLEEHAFKVIVEKLLRRPASAVKDQHDIVFARDSNRDVVNANLGHRLAVMKPIIPDDAIAGARGSCKQNEKQKTMHGVPHDSSSLL